MCYEESFYRSWAARKKVQKRESQQPVIEPDRAELKPVDPAPVAETTRPKEVERELEEIV
jgi:hypothetical protein